MYARSKSLHKQTYLLPAITAGSALLLVLTGCGLGTRAVESDVALGNVKGLVLGGNIPIQNSTITLYATSATATDYGQAATVLGVTTTDATGSFNIQPTVTCPAGQQTYITAAGGYQTGQPTLVNTSVLEMTALGPCGVLAGSTNIAINELTTVVAGYALSGFLTTSAATDGSGLYIANVSAPAGNNSSTATAKAPAGLSHAFKNASNLVNFQTGKVNQTFNASFAGTTTPASVPVQEINTLGDILQSCVDAASGNANCSGIFGLMKSVTGVTPLNTLQAVAYLARNPYPSVAALDPTSGLISYSKASGAAYQPALATVPNDWSMAITYGRTGTTAGTLPVGYWLTLDANDNAYQGYATTTTTTPAIYGVGVYGSSIPAFGAQAAGTVTRGIATDQLGYVWVTNNANSATRFNLSSGTIGSTFTSTIAGTYGVAVDRLNNLWLGHFVPTATTPTNVEQVVDTGVSAGMAATGTYAPTLTAAAPYAPYGVTVDANQNIWLAGYTSAGTGATAGTQSIVLSNLGSSTAPSYTASGTTITPITATFAGGAAKPYSVVIDNAGNGWTAITGAPATATTATTGIEEVIPNATKSPSSLNPQAFIPGTTAGDRSNTLNTTAVQMMAIDGAGTIFIPDNTTGNGVKIYTTKGGLILSPSSAIRGCYLSSTTVTACSTGSASAIYNPRQLAVDSTGSLWMGDTTASMPGVTQVIGIAAPSYPVLAVGQPGVQPGTNAVAVLP